MNSITSAAGVLAKNNLANARNRYEFAAMACGSAAGLYFIYFLLVVISKKNMRISIDRTIIRIEGGSVFENISEIIDILLLQEVQVVQDFLNMLTGDGSLRVIYATPKVRSLRTWKKSPVKAYIDIKGIAKFSELEALALKLRSLRLRLRSLPYLDTGIRQ